MMAWNCNYIIVKNRSIDVAQQKNQNLLSLKTRTPYTCTSHVFDTLVVFKSCAESVVLDLSDSVLLESNNSVVFKLTNIVKLLADRYRFAETLMAIWIEFSVDSSVMFTAVVIGVGPGPIVWASIQSGSNSILDKEFRTLVLFRRSLTNIETSLVKSKCKN